MVMVSDRLVLYDGVCALCNGLVKFVVKRDRRDRFRFAPLQGERARAIVRGSLPGAMSFSSTRPMLSDTWRGHAVF